MKRIVIVVALLATGVLFHPSIVSAENLLSDGSPCVVPDAQSVARATRVPPTIEREHWRVDAWIFPEEGENRYRIELRRHAMMPFTWAVRPSDLEFAVLSWDGKAPTPPDLRVAVGTPDVLHPETCSERGCSGDTISVHLNLNRENAPSGMYTFRITGRVDARDEKMEHRVILPTFKATLVVFLPPLPDRKPALEPGQRFMAPPWLNDHLAEPSSFRDVSTGDAVKWDRVLGKVFTLASVEQVRKKRRYVFSLKDHPRKVCIEGDFTVRTVPHLIPLVTDSTVRALKAKYEGGKVWSPGGAEGSCIWTLPNMSCDMTGPVTTPLLIKRIERMYMSYEYFSFRGGTTDPDSADYGGFVSSNPLIVLLDVPEKGLELGSCGWYSTDPDDQQGDEWYDRMQKNPRQYCKMLWYEVADRWDFERKYSLQPPWEAHPEWPKKMINAIREGHAILGMTPEMVVWVWGWPSVYGSLAELSRMSEWEYMTLPGRWDYLHFRNGRLISIDPSVSP